MIGKLFKWLFGGGGDVIGTVGRTVDALHTSDAEAGALDNADADSARQFAAPSNAPGVFNQLVDGVNRLIRPGVTVWLIGGFAGWWALPRTDELDPGWFSIFTIVITFWFGGRLLIRDLPAAILSLRRR